ncbi:MAG: signal peptidase I [Clostridiales bacterium]|nr:signal peptidase I [Candidatus Cacconaster stercorequi]
MSRSNTALSTEEILRQRGSAAGLRRGYIELLFRLIFIAAAAWLVLNYGFAILSASGNEMFPAVKDGDLVIAYRLQKDYYQNDPVVYSHEGEKRIGRVVAGEGDVVQITESGALIVNGTTQSGEIYFATYPREDGGTELRVPENSFYILGDYRTNSTDSRDFGAVSADDLIGKVITVMRRRGI